MSVVIGITGGVGCGKSTVLEILQNEYGAAIIEADKIGHLVMEPGGLAYNRIIKIFGNGILEDNNLDKESARKIDRKKLGEVAFNDKTMLTKLNGIIHPVVKDYIENFISLEKSKNTKYIVVEAALLIEAGYRDICDIFWYIYANREVRAERLIKSRGYSIDKINSIINNQLTEEEFIKNTDIVIYNNGDYENLYNEISSKLPN